MVNACPRTRFWWAGLWLTVLSVRSGVSAEPPVRNIVLPAGTAESESGRLWGVVIGINSYSDPAIPQLQFGVADARRIAAVLERCCGCDPARILLLTDDQPGHHYPTGGNLREQTRQWLLQAQPGDTVLVFFSGHGFLDAAGQAFLAPQDCRRDQLGLTGVRTDELRDMLRQCRAARQVLILDCCHAGSTKGDARSESSADIAESFRRARGLITLASCGKSEYSVEWPDKGHGLYTYFLAEGLAGAADRNADGLVDSDELYQYVSERVPLTALQLFNAVQMPVRYFGEDTAGVFCLARTAPGSDSTPLVTGAAFASPGSAGSTLPGVAGGAAGTPDRAGGRSLATVAGTFGVLVGIGGLCLWGVRRKHRRAARDGWRVLQAALRGTRQRLARLDPGPETAGGTAFRELDLVLDRLLRRLETAGPEQAGGEHWRRLSGELEPVLNRIGGPLSAEEWRHAAEELQSKLLELEVRLVPPPVPRG